MTLDYQATDKIDLSGSGGIEFRQGGSSANSTFGSNDSGSGDSYSPVFSAALTYKPAESNQLSLFGYESVQTSNGNSDQNVTNTGFGFSASQRIVHRFYLGFTFYYSHSEYTDNTTSTTVTGGGVKSTTAGFVGSTQDNYVYRPSFSFQPTAWSNVGLYYQYLQNAGTGTAVGYHDNQVGASVSFQF